MFQTRVLATAIAALVASTHVIEAEGKEDRANHRQDTKTEFLFADCKVQEKPHMKGVFKIRQNEEGNFEVDGGDESSSDFDDEDSLFKVTLDQEASCSVDEFQGTPLTVGYNSNITELLTTQSGLLSHQISVSKLGETVLLADGQAVACCRLQDQTEIPPLKVTEVDSISDQIDFSSDEDIDEELSENYIDEPERQVDSDDTEWDDDDEEEDSNSDSIQSDEDSSDLDNESNSEDEQYVDNKEEAIEANESKFLQPDYTEDLENESGMQSNFKQSSLVDTIVENLDLNDLLQNGIDAQLNMFDDDTFPYFIPQTGPPPSRPDFKNPTIEFQVNL